MGISSFLAKQARKPAGWFGRVFTGKLLNKANASLEDMGLKLMDIKPDSEILEIGFGNGRLISNMSEIIESGKITGIEISNEMILLAEKRNMSSINKGKVQLINASIEQIPVDNKSFDIIFTSNTIYFWPNPDEDIKEIIRTLNNDGKFYCAIRPIDQMAKMKMVSANKDIFRNLFSKSDIKEFLVKAGFKDVSVFVEEEKRFTNIVAVGTKK